MNEREEKLENQAMIYYMDFLIESRKSIYWEICFQIATTGKVVGADIERFQKGYNTAQEMESDGSYLGNFSDKDGYEYRRIILKDWNIKIKEKLDEIK